DATLVGLPDGLTDSRLSSAHMAGRQLKRRLAS
ncbi:hypothetical protein A2U01_0092777, partial [Trifolium medium]|nr:hypothetical protein [Trifolium medium]